MFNDPDKNVIPTRRQKIPQEGDKLSSSIPTTTHTHTHTHLTLTQRKDDGESPTGFRMTHAQHGQAAVGAGFSLKF